MELCNPRQLAATALLLILFASPGVIRGDPVPAQPRVEGAQLEPKSGLEFVPLAGGALAGGNFAGVRVAPFSLGRTATTVAAYARCVAAGACTKAVDGDPCNAGSARADHPINCVRWSQAAAFCSWIGGRLPTSQEREWAESGGEGREHPWGAKAPGDQLCWDGRGSSLGAGKRKTTCPVGAFPRGRSKQGLLDLEGNVSEWLESDYMGKKEVRGGSWMDDSPLIVRATYRRRHDPSPWFYSIGFRCAR